jgi:hypothetical protein
LNYTNLILISCGFGAFHFDFDFDFDLDLDLGNVPLYRFKPLHTELANGLFDFCSSQNLQFFWCRKCPPLPRQIMMNSKFPKMVVVGPCSSGKTALIMLLKTHLRCCSPQHLSRIQTTIGFEYSRMFRNTVSETDCWEVSGDDTFAHMSDSIMGDFDVLLNICTYEDFVGRQHKLQTNTFPLNSETDIENQTDNIPSETETETESETETETPDQPPLAPHNGAISTRLRRRVARAEVQSPNSAIIHIVTKCDAANTHTLGIGSASDPYRVCVESGLGIVFVRSRIKLECKKWHESHYKPKPSYSNRDVVFVSSSPNHNKTPSTCSHCVLS